MSADPTSIARRFRLEGDLVGAARLERGHINDTYVVRTRRRRYLLQRLSPQAFPDPRAVVDNVARVTAHLRAKLEGRGVPDPERRCLTLVPSREGELCVRDHEGACWRVYHYIEGARARDRAESTLEAERAARAFADFARELADLPGPRLAETIPGFHDTPARLDALERAARADPVGRAGEVEAELDFVRARRALARALLDLAVPERVVHNDTKLNNVLFDAESGEALCVVDLDTVMPGLALYDFGDLVRSCANAAAEDGRDLAAVRVRLPVFAALVRGYLAGAGALLTGEERARLAVAGQVLALEAGARFLTDHIEGDRYFRLRRPSQNLERARVHLRLLESMETEEPAMRAAAEAAAREAGLAASR